MSVESSPNATIHERTRAIRATYSSMGHPPTARDCAGCFGRSHDWCGFRESVWDDMLRSAGVPGYDDVVAAAIRERYENRYPWQDFVTIRAGMFTDETGLNPSHIGQKIGQIASGERSPAATEGLRFVCCGTGHGHTKWEVYGDE